MLIYSFNAPKPSQFSSIWFRISFILSSAQIHVSNYISPSQITFQKWK
jgi:hypothetical protein